MSMWKDLFSIYQSVQADEDAEAAVDSLVKKAEVGATADEKNDDSTEGEQRSVYVFAYIDDGKGNISRNIAVEDRITLLELKNQELEFRYNRLLEQLDEAETDEQDED